MARLAAVWRRSWNRSAALSGGSAALTAARQLPALPREERFRFADQPLVELGASSMNEGSRLAKRRASLVGAPAPCEEAGITDHHFRTVKPILSTFIRLECVPPDVFPLLVPPLCCAQMSHLGNGSAEEPMRLA
jgi:hypothetical protein